MPYLEDAALSLSITSGTGEFRKRGRRTLYHHRLRIDFILLASYVDDMLVPNALTLPLNAVLKLIRKTEKKSGKGFLLNLVYPCF